MLEDRLGVTLFEWLGWSLSLMQLGLEFFEHVCAMGDVVGCIALIAFG